MNVEALVLGIGNDFRCDDGVGVAVARRIAELRIVGIRVMIDVGDPGSVLDAWTDVPLVIAVDAARCDAAQPGRIRRWSPGCHAASAVVSSHGFGLAQTLSLGEALGRLPRRLVIFTVDVEDVSRQATLTPAVASIVPQVVEAILTELESDAWAARHRPPRGLSRPEKTFGSA
ncbi:hydrogenase maturation protease [Mycolicibacterium septicum]|nr:hydrogenase maturation protease [Mycolicibacterium septicum]